VRVVNHIGVSGGKDSTALLLWAVHESGYPRETLDVTFCDTENEHELTLAYIDMLSRKVHPITTLKPPLGFYDLARKKKRFPSAKARFCTQELKMKPTQAHVMSLVGPETQVVLHSGVRAAESLERSKLEPESFDDYFACLVRRPLLRWKIEDVWAMHAKHKISPNPLYALGAKRVGCLPCIMSSKAEINMMSRQFPERIDMLREAEQSFDNINGSTFFAPRTVTERHRTKEIVTAKGVRMKVATIDDVVRWSRTVRGGKQYALAPWAEDRDSDFDRHTCPSTMGACE
jgi:3'-phosphoadenosine 5'-phosphosulfate sulfotransferase (PAPS reductase)/FAD synthetase